MLCLVSDPYGDGSLLKVLSQHLVQCGGRGGLRCLLTKPGLCTGGSGIGEESLLGEFGFPKPIWGLPESLVHRNRPALLPTCLPENRGYLSLSVPQYQFQTNITEFNGLNFFLTQMILLLVCIHYSALILYPESQTCQACLNSLAGKSKEYFIHLKVALTCSMTMNDCIFFS